MSWATDVMLWTAGPNAVAQYVCTCRRLCVEIGSFCTEYVSSQFTRHQVDFLTCVYIVHLQLAVCECTTQSPSQEGCCGVCLRGGCGFVGTLVSDATSKGLWGPPNFVYCVCRAKRTDSEADHVATSSAENRKQ
jgi:hypothetical protein